MVLIGSFIALYFLLRNQNKTGIKKANPHEISIIEDQEKIIINRLKSGDHFGGGVIVYTDEKGEHGLICSKESPGIGSFLEATIGGGIKWKDANKLCKEYKGGGYSNWRLPTDLELNLIFLILKKYGKKRILFNLPDGLHWSSIKDNMLGPSDTFTNMFGKEQYDNKGDRESTETKHYKCFNFRNGTLIPFWASDSHALHIAVRTF